jgi:transcriptional regulator with XRE-family HTH domain
MTPEFIRTRLRAYMKRKDLKPYPWAARAGLSENTLATFLNEPNRSITARTLEKLADAEGISIPELLQDGDERSPGTGDNATPRASNDLQIVLSVLQDIRALMNDQRALLQQNNELLQALTAPRHRAITR